MSRQTRYKVKGFCSKYEAVALFAGMLFIPVIVLYLANVAGLV